MPFAFILNIPDMKKNILLSVFSLSLLITAAQDPGKQVKDEWTNITTELMRKVDLAKNVLFLAEELKTVDREMFNKTKAYALVLDKSLQLSKGPDSVTVEIIRRRNDGLTLTLYKFIKELDADKKFKSSIELTDYASNLDVLEKKLASHIAAYNSAVNEKGRKDLYYKIPLK